MPKYNHQQVERKWQKRWEESNLNRAVDFSKKPKFYCLVEFPYPSGDGLHVGHTRTYTALDIIARKRRLEGYNVLFPIGFDAFGLPTENYAIKTGVHPAKVTAQNVKKFTTQLKSVGFSFDWDRVVVTTDPKYYKWTQWIFLKLFEHGLAYKQKAAINWCTSCKIGLANEEVVNGVCERCGSEVEKREKEQWLLKITKYADRLINDLGLVDYVERIKTQQVNWIGKSIGAEVDFKIIAENRETTRNYTRLRSSSYGGQARNYAKTGSGMTEKLRVFTTRPDTLFGATFMVVAPEHEIITNYQLPITNYEEVRKYVEAAKRKSDLERTELSKEKTGVELKGIKAINPVSGIAIPIFVADYVLMGYGTGAIMAVPAHDARDWEFAKKYNLPIIKVVETKDKQNQKSKIKNQNDKSKIKNDLDDVYEGEGFAVNSGKFDGLTTKEFKKKITEWLERKGVGKSAVNYKLRDWIFSRQHYWGEPIPIIYCRKCREVQSPKSKVKSNEGIDYVIFNGLEYAVVPVPEKDLPLELPKVEKYQPTDTGESPLAAMKKWVNTQCPKCGGEAKRETDTMPNWAGSNWYFLRYCDPNNDKKLADPQLLNYWTPVDWYNGGMEHTTLHLLYSRFIYKFLWDIGAVPKSCGPEPYKKRTAHGMVLGKGGEKMSKSRGNVVTPDEVVAEFGADVLRVYEMFIGPFGQAAAWDSKGILGVKRFLDKVWSLAKITLANPSRIKTRESVANTPSPRPSPPKGGEGDMVRLLHQTIKKVSEDIEAMRFNTAVSALMILVNELAKSGIDKKTFETFLILLAPFAPHLVEELWEKLGHKKSVFKEKWPRYDEKLARVEEIELVVQVNGKVRDKVKVAADITEDEARTVALESENVKRHVGDKKIKKVIFVKGRLINLVM